VTGETAPGKSVAGPTRPGAGPLAEADIVVLAGRPDAAELAAITAVLSGALEELAAERGRQEQAGPTAWNRSQRALRAPLHPGPGAWRSFGA
jgi:hypothetical protein